MSREFEHYHGVVFTRILHASFGQPVTIGTYPSESNASYVINGSVGLYLKHSTKRVSPWMFTFKKLHLDEIKEMYERFGEVFIGLICKDDGVAMLNFHELKKILDENYGVSEWVRVTRRRRTQYGVSGSDGKLDFKVTLKSCPEKILEYLKLNAHKSGQSRTASVFPKPLASLSA